MIETVRKEIADQTAPTKIWTFAIPLLPNINNLIEFTSFRLRWNQINRFTYLLYLHVVGNHLYAPVFSVVFGFLEA